MSKLPLVIVLVAVHASRELDLVNRRWARGYMALRALYRRMLTLQRISGLTMIRNCKLRRLPAIHGVARLAFAPIRTLRKLPAMRVFMAIAAEPERDYLRKVATLVTGRAFHVNVLSEQREWSLRVIEFLIRSAGLP